MRIRRPPFAPLAAALLYSGVSAHYVCVLSPLTPLNPLLFSHEFVLLTLYTCAHTSTCITLSHIRSPFLDVGEVESVCLASCPLGKPYHNDIRNPQFTYNGGALCVSSCSELLGTVANPYVLNGSSWLTDASDSALTTAVVSAVANASSSAAVACSTQDIYLADKAAYADAYPVSSGSSAGFTLSLWMMILIALGVALLVAIVVALRTRSKNRKQAAAAAAAAAQRAAEDQELSLETTTPAHVNRVPANMASITLSPTTYVFTSPSPFVCETFLFHATALPEFDLDLWYQYLCCD